jgi:hypothetical protein
MFNPAETNACHLESVQCSSRPQNVFEKDSYYVLSSLLRRGLKKAKQQVHMAVSFQTKENLIYFDYLPI